MQPLSNMKRRVLLLAGWLVATGGLFAAVWALDVHWNLFSWGGGWDFRALFYVLCVLAAVVATWFLARSTRDRAVAIASLVLSVVLLGFGLYLLLAESDPWPGKPSPIWYRGIRALLMALPLVFWLGHRREGRWLGR